MSGAIIATLDDGATITLTLHDVTLDRTVVWPTNVLKAARHKYDTASGQVAVTLDAVYEPALPEPIPPGPVIT